MANTPSDKSSNVVNTGSSAQKVTSKAITSIGTPRKVITTSKRPIVTRGQIPSVLDKQVWQSRKYNSDTEVIMRALNMLSDIHFAGWDFNEYANYDVLKNEAISQVPTVDNAAFTEEAWNQWPLGIKVLVLDDSKDHLDGTPSTGQYNVTYVLANIDDGAGSYVRGLVPFSPGFSLNLGGRSSVLVFDTYADYLNADNTAAKGSTDYIPGAITEGSIVILLKTDNNGVLSNNPIGYIKEVTTNSSGQSHFLTLLGQKGDGFRLAGVVLHQIAPTLGIYNPISTTDKADGVISYVTDKTNSGKTFDEVLRGYLNSTPPAPNETATFFERIASMVLRGVVENGDGFIFKDVTDQNNPISELWIWNGTNLLNYGGFTSPSSSGSNTAGISKNTADISKNATDISTNTTSIKTNTTNIGTNTNEINSLKTNQQRLVYINSSAILEATPPTPPTFVDGNIPGTSTPFQTGDLIYQQTEDGNGNKSGFDVWKVDTANGSLAPTLGRVGHITSTINLAAYATKLELTNGLSDKADAATTYSKSEIDAAQTIQNDKITALENKKVGASITKYVDVAAFEAVAKDGDFGWVKVGTEYKLYLFDNNKAQSITGSGGGGISTVGTFGQIDITKLDQLYKVTDMDGRPGFATAEPGFVHIDSTGAITYIKTSSEIGKILNGLLDRLSNLEDDILEQANIDKSLRANQIISGTGNAIDKTVVNGADVGSGSAIGNGKSFDISHITNGVTFTPEFIGNTSVGAPNVVLPITMPDGSPFKFVKADIVPTAIKIGTADWTYEITGDTLTLKKTSSSYDIAKTMILDGGIIFGTTDIELKDKVLELEKEVNAIESGVAAGHFDTTADRDAAIPNPVNKQWVTIGTAEPYTIYRYNGTAWVTGGFTDTKGLAKDDLTNLTKPQIAVVDVLAPPNNPGTTFKRESVGDAMTAGKDFASAEFVQGLIANLWEAFGGVNATDPNPNIPFRELNKLMNRPDIKILIQNILDGKKVRTNDNGNNTIQNLGTFLKSASTEDLLTFEKAVKEIANAIDGEQAKIFDNIYVKNKTSTTKNFVKFEDNSLGANGFAQFLATSGKNDLWIDSVPRLAEESATEEGIEIVASPDAKSLYLGWEFNFGAGGISYIKPASMSAQEKKDRPLILFQELREVNNVPTFTYLVASPVLPGDNPAGTQSPLFKGSVNTVDFTITAETQVTKVEQRLYRDFNTGIETMTSFYISDYATSKAPKLFGYNTANDYDETKPEAYFKFIGNMTDIYNYVLTKFVSINNTISSKMNINADNYDITKAEFPIDPTTGLPVLAVNKNGIGLNPVDLTTQFVSRTQSAIDAGKLLGIDPNTFKVVPLKVGYPQFQGIGNDLVTVVAGVTNPNDGDVVYVVNPTGGFTIYKYKDSTVTPGTKVWANIGNISASAVLPNTTKLERPVNVAFYDDTALTANDTKFVKGSTADDQYYISASEVRAPSGAYAQQVDFRADIELPITGNEVFDGLVGNLTPKLPQLVFSGYVFWLANVAAGNFFTVRVNLEEWADNLNAVLPLMDESIATTVYSSPRIAGAQQLIATAIRFKIDKNDLNKKLTIQVTEKPVHIEPGKNPYSDDRYGVMFTTLSDSFEDLVITNSDYEQRLNKLELRISNKSFFEEANGDTKADIDAISGATIGDRAILKTIGPPAAYQSYVFDGSSWLLTNTTSTNPLTTAVSGGGGGGGSATDSAAIGQNKTDIAANKAALDTKEDIADNAATDNSQNGFMKIRQWDPTTQTYTNKWVHVPTQVQGSIQGETWDVVGTTTISKVKDYPTGAKSGISIDQSATENSTKILTEDGVYGIKHQITVSEDDITAQVISKSNNTTPYEANVPEGVVTKKLLDDSIATPISDIASLKTDKMNVNMDNVTDAILTAKLNGLNLGTYKGSSAADPTAGPYNDGDFYYNTTDSSMKFYVNGVWGAPFKISEKTLQLTGTGTGSPAGKILSSDYTAFFNANNDGASIFRARINFTSAGTQPSGVHYAICSAYGFIVEKASIDHLLYEEWKVDNNPANDVALGKSYDMFDPVIDLDNLPVANADIGKLLGIRKDVSGNTTLVDTNLLLAQLDASKNGLDITDPTIVDLNLQSDNQTNSQVAPTSTGDFLTGATIPETASIYIDKLLANAQVKDGNEHWVRLTLNPRTGGQKLNGADPTPQTFFNWVPEFNYVGDIYASSDTNKIHTILLGNGQATLTAHILHDYFKTANWGHVYLKLQYTLSHFHLNAVSVDGTKVYQIAQKSTSSAGIKNVAVDKNKNNDYILAKADGTDDNHRLATVGYTDNAITDATGDFATKDLANTAIKLGSKVKIGVDAGDTSQGVNAVAIGNAAGNATQGLEAVAIGFQAGNDRQGNYGAAIGRTAGKTEQGAYGIAVGFAAGETSQGAGSIALGQNAGKTQQGANSIAIGYSAGAASQPNGSIVLNASNLATNNGTANEILMQAGTNKFEWKADGLYINGVKPTSGPVGGATISFDDTNISAAETAQVGW